MAEGQYISQKIQSLLRQIFPHENLADLKNYLIRQLELNGVEVKTGTEVTQELINSEAPDAVILAAGGLRDTLTVDVDNNALVQEGVPWTGKVKNGNTPIQCPAPASTHRVPLYGKYAPHLPSRQTHRPAFPHYSALPKSSWRLGCALLHR